MKVAPIFMVTVTSLQRLSMGAVLCSLWRRGAWGWEAGAGHTTSCIGHSGASEASTKQRSPWARGSIPCLWSSGIWCSALIFILAFKEIQKTYPQTCQLKLGKPCPLHRSEVKVTLTRGCWLPSSICFCPSKGLFESSSAAWVTFVLSTGASRDQ